MDAFCKAGLISRNPVLSPSPVHPEVVFSNTADGPGGEDEEDPSDLFGQEVNDTRVGTIAGSAVDPNGVEVTLSEGEELEETAVQQILPDPGEPTASQREDHRASGHISFRSWCEDCVAGRATGEQHRKRK